MEIQETVSKITFEGLDIPCITEHEDYKALKTLQWSSKLVTWWNTKMVVHAHDVLGKQRIIELSFIFKPNYAFKPKYHNSHILYITRIVKRFGCTLHTCRHYIVNNLILCTHLGKKSLQFGDLDLLCSQLWIGQNYTQNGNEEGLIETKKPLMPSQRHLLYNFVRWEMFASKNVFIWMKVGHFSGLCSHAVR